MCVCVCVQDYDTFFNAKEDNTVFAFLGLPPPPGSKVSLFLPSTPDKYEFVSRMNDAATPVLS